MATRMQVAASSSRAFGSTTRRASTKRFGSSNWTTASRGFRGTSRRRGFVVHASQRLDDDASSRASLSDASSKENTSSRRGIFRGITATALGAACLESVELATFPSTAFAQFNKDLDVPIEDPIQAIAVIYAVRGCITDIIAQMDLFSETCPAPVFPCDLSQLSSKASTRVSGPLKRSLPALTEAFGCDPYAVQDIVQSVSTTEAMLMANNARVKVDFKSPTTYFELVDASIVAFLEEVPPEKLAQGKALYDACDFSVDAKAEGSLECRLGRAVAQNTRPAGGIG